MEGDIVVFALGSEVLDLGNVLGRDIRHQLDHDRAILQLDGQEVLVGLGLGSAEAGDGQQQSGCELDELHDHSRFLRSAAQRPYLELRAASTGAGTKALTSPPMAAIWRTNVAVMGREAVAAGRKTVCTSGAMVAFMPAICIS